jgi:hypothetical protein
MMRTKFLEEKFRQGRLDAKALDNLFRRRIEQGAEKDMQRGISTRSQSDPSTWPRASPFTPIYSCPRSEFRAQLGWLFNQSGSADADSAATGDGRRRRAAERRSSPMQ